MGADEQSLDWAFIAERRKCRVFVQRGMMGAEQRSCDIIPGLKRTNMLLRTELGLMGAL